MPLAEQAPMRAILRRARYGSLRAFPILLLGAAGRNPTEIAAFLCCARSSVSRIVYAYRTGSLGVRIAADGPLSVAVQSTILMPSYALARCPAQQSSTGLWLVPHPVAVCHARSDAPGPTGHRGVRREGVSELWIGSPL